MFISEKKNTKYCESVLKIGLKTTMVIEILKRLHAIIESSKNWLYSFHQERTSNFTYYL